MKCTCNEHSPFLWHKHKRDSIFMKDPHFRPRGDTGKTTGQIQSDQIEKRRAKGEEPGFLKGVSRKREEEILSYRVFGVYSRAKTTIKPHKNRHEK